MADLDLRIDRDVLTIAAGAREDLERGGLDLDVAGPMTLAIEPEVIEAAVLCDVQTGAQCVVINPINFAPACLRQTSSLDKAEELAKACLDIVKNQRLQHPLVRVFPCGLPLDETSTQSQKEHYEQYKFIAKLFAGREIDGYLFDSFTNATDLKCALLAIRENSAKTLVYTTQNLDIEAAKEIKTLDLSPASGKLLVIDYGKCAHIDDLLDQATSAAANGTQFLMVSGANYSKTAAIAAITQGQPVKC